MWEHCGARPVPRTGLASMSWRIGWRQSPAADGKPTGAATTSCPRRPAAQPRPRPRTGGVRASPAPRTAAWLHRKALRMTMPMRCGERITADWYSHSTASIFTNTSDGITSDTSRANLRLPTRHGAWAFRYFLTRRKCGEHGVHGGNFIMLLAVEPGRTGDRCSHRNAAARRPKFSEIGDSMPSAE